MGSCYIFLGTEATKGPRAVASDEEEGLQDSEELKYAGRVSEERAGSPQAF